VTFRRAAVIAFGCAALAALAGCTSSTSGSGSGSGSASGSATGSTAVSSSSAAPTSPSTAVSSTTSAAAPAACTGGQLKVTWTNPPGGAAAGHIGIVLLFQNSSTSTCTLSGYPGPDGLDSSGHSVAHATRTLNGMIGFCGCSTPPTLTLGPGVVVSAVVEGDSAGASGGAGGGSGGGAGGNSCAAFPAMLVTPPNTSTSTQIPASPYSCDFTVHPVVTGLAGQS
jgi:uncharacterized protein DUF4232